jgi:primosomal protein N' (replication factor Y)
VRVCLLIPTRALPPLSYSVPDALVPAVGPGAAVAAPLSGYSRLGIVVGEEPSGERPLQEIRRVIDRLSIGPELLELCRRISDSCSAPLPAVLRLALPPGLRDAYRVLDPAPGWSWRPGSRVSRGVLRRELGGEGLKLAEAAGRVELDPVPPHPPAAEWATLLRDAADGELDRAPRQRQLLETLKELGGEAPVRALLSGAGASRAALPRLAERGLIRLWRRVERSYIHGAEGGGSRGSLAAAYPELEALSGGGALVWRLPLREQAGAAAAAALRAVGRGEQALILLPEARMLEEVRRALVERLPRGVRIAAYHGGAGAERAEVYEAAKRGGVDVVVGTRPAVLLPLARPGVAVVVDEPNESHRSAPALEYENAAFHTRDAVLERQRLECMELLFLSPAPSLELRAAGLRELPPRELPGRPGIRLVDLRGSGVALSAHLLDEIRCCIRYGGRAGVLVNRLGYATVVRCNGCGAVATCLRCDLPERFHRRTRMLVCGGCGSERPAPEACESCGSGRLSFTGLTVERVREGLKRRLGTGIGLHTAELSEDLEAPAVVGTARKILECEWDLIAVPDADSLLQAGGFRAVEKGFRILFTAVERARSRLAVQTRDPEHYALRAALRRDYEGFARAELSRRRAAGYPPYSHLAVLTLEGSESGVLHAVESTRPDPGVDLLGPIPLENGSRWQAILRARDRESVAAAARRAARGASRVRGVRVQVDIDPEEV